MAFCLVAVSLDSQVFCLNSAPQCSWMLSFSLVCFSHPQGGRDEGNYLDDALMRQDAQVGRTACSFSNFLLRNRHFLLQGILARLRCVINKRLSQVIFNTEIIAGVPRI